MSFNILNMIKEITTTVTFLVRLPVLRAGKTIESCRFDGDNLETTKHFGYFINKKLVGVVSIYKISNKIYPEFNQYQLRGMAILNEYQNKGFGEKLVIYCENYAIQNQNKLIWFNARTSAVKFYEKLGYSKSGKSFEIPEIGEHFLMNKLFVDKN